MCRRQSTCWFDPKPQVYRFYPAASQIQPPSLRSCAVRRSAQISACRLHAFYSRDFALRELFRSLRYPSPIQLQASLAELERGAAVALSSPLTFASIISGASCGFASCSRMPTIISSSSSFPSSVVTLSASSPKWDFEGAYPKDDDGQQRNWPADDPAGNAC